MDRPKSNCSDSSESVLGWFDMESSIIDEDIETSVPDSPPLNIVVPDSLDPDDLGIHVAETEFQEPCLFVPKSPGFDFINIDDDGCRSDGKKRKKVVKISDLAKSLLREVAEKRKRLDDGDMSSGISIENIDKLPEQLPETRSSFRLRQYEERFLAGLKKSSN